MGGLGEVGELVTMILASVFACKMSRCGGLLGEYMVETRCGSRHMTM